MSKDWGAYMDNTDLYYCVTNTNDSKLQYFGTIYILADVLLFYHFFRNQVIFNLP
jgi:hypothetical protein